MTIRSFLTFIAAMIAVALPSEALAKEGATADLTIAHVYTGWRDAASFKRISEYFDGKENTGGEAVLRTQRDQRAGYYFLVRTANPSTARTIKAQLQIITSSHAKPVSHEFSAELKAGATVFHLGLTGSDWPDAAANPVAWKLELVDSDGRILATEKSYLWENPAAK